METVALAAHAMLEKIGALVASHPSPFRAAFTFHQTTDWRQAVRDFNDPSQR